MKGLIYKDLLVTKKYYITTFIIFIILHLFIREKWTAIMMPLLLLIFQNACMKSIFSSDKHGNFSEFVDGAVGRNYRVKGVYLYTIMNVVICGLITLGYFIHSNIDSSLALKFNCIQLLIYLFIYLVCSVTNIYAFGYSSYENIRICNLSICLRNCFWINQ